MKIIKNKYDFKFNIPSVLQAIAEEDNPDVIEKYENITVSMYASILLYFAAISNFLVRYYVLEHNFKISILTSLIFLFIGIAFDISVRVNIKSRTMTLIISILSFFTSMFICIIFYDIIGPAVWTAVFIQLLLALVRVTSHMLYFISSAVILSNIYILFNSYYTSDFSKNYIYYIVQMVLFVVIFIISAGVHKINVDRYKKVKKQFKEVIENKKSIECLYDKVIASEEKNKHLAYHDSLTSLPNRMFLSEKLNNDIFRSKQNEKLLAVIFLDLDNFKMVNDSMGHTIGDQLLIKVSERLVHTVRECDTVARIGGDEFIILINDVEDVDSIGNIAEKILTSLQQAIILRNKDFFVTTSMGISVYPLDGKDADTLIKNADIAMYKAKEYGRNQFAFCSESIKSKGIDNMKMSNLLYRAIERNELEVYYQPQVNSNSGKIIGLEALLRWNSTELGMVMPETFIPIAEKTGLIISIGEWVLRTACNQNKDWQDSGLSRIPVAVNVSIRQFDSRKIFNQVQDILTQTGLDPKYLELEITESVAMKESGYIIDTLNNLKNLGIFISIDDFGTAYSSLSNLKRLPVDKIKIAMPFIHGIDVSNKDEAITKAVILMGKSMGLRVIAEGVETENQLSFLNKRMCDEIQGFYYFKPMPKSEVEKLL
ncbi:MAG: putative bifunctional diguanylate cyclase/phosphodiesterase [Sedimentibacter sp.]